MTELGIPAAPENSPVTPLPASTVLLVRDGGEGLEVFMVVRNRAIAFASGAMVFPGGKVDPEDRAPELLQRCAGIEGLSIEDAALRVSAVRETFEEAGVLLARPGGRDAPLPATRAAALAVRWRQKLLDGDAGFEEMVRSEDLILDCGSLIHYAHWITPPGGPRRFDTHFFIAAAPPGQAAGHDGSESTASRWVRPADAIADLEAGRVSMVFATHMNLDRLGRSGTVAETLAQARAATVVTVRPQGRRVVGGRLIRLPEQAGYGAGEIFVSYGPA